MMITWALFGLWLIFTLLDLAISGLALHFGSGIGLLYLAPVKVFGEWLSGWCEVSLFEGGLLFQLSGNFGLTCFIKGIAAFLFGMILVAYKAKVLLALACALYFLLCVWNGCILLIRMGVG